MATDDINNDDVNDEITGSMCIDAARASYGRDSNDSLITEEEARQLFIAQFVGLPRAQALKQLKIRGTEFCDIAAGRRILRPQILKRMGLYKVIRYAHIEGKKGLK